MAARKKASVEGQIAEEREITLDQTEGFEIVIETFLSNRSSSGTDKGYGIRNKRTGVVEMRWGAYSEAIQGLAIAQENLDKHQSAFEKSTGRLN